MSARGSMKALLLLSTILAPIEVFAQDDSFVLGDAPVVQAPLPVLRNFVEGGLGYQTDAPYYMARYGGILHEAPYLIFKAGLAGGDPWDSKRATYWDADADVLGFDTRSFRARYGEQGKWRLGTSYDAFARAYTERAYTPFEGVGGTTLTLPLNWVPSTSSAGFTTLNRSLKAVKLRVSWETVAGDFVLTPYQRYEVRLHTRYRVRDGLRAQSLPFGVDGDTAVGVFFPQRVDYRSSDITGTIGYADRRLQWSLGYTFSAFSDQIDATKVSDPFSRLVGPPGPAGAAAGYPNAVGQYSSPPDSSAHHVLGTLGYSITPMTRFTARASYIVQNQNDPFLPYTANPLLAAPTPLPRTSLQGSIQKTNIALGLTAQPFSPLDLSARYTFDDRNNRSPTDVYNYVANDVQNQFPLVPGASRYIRLNLPHSFTFHDAKLEAKYRFGPRVSLVVGYDGDFQYRTNQQVDYTAEHALRAKLLGTFESGSGWVSYRYASRTGSTYNDALPWNMSHTQAYLAASRNNQSIEFPQMRKYHLADRDRQEVKAGATFDATQAVVFNLSGGYNATTYPDSPVGLNKQKSLVLDADVSYAVETVTASAFYTFERMLSRQTGYIVGNGNLTNAQQYWQTGNRDTTHTVGIRADWRVVPGKYKLGVNYDLSLGGMRTDFESNPFVVYTVTAPLPDTREITHNFGVKAEYAVRVDTTVKIGYNFQRHVSRDWQYDLSIAPVAQILGSGITPPRYTAHVFSLTTRFDF